MNKNRFALTPPMGWNSYDYYDTSVTEAEVKANADYMAAHLKEYGWEYIIVDIQWYAHGAGSMRSQYQYIPFGDLEMDAYGRLLPDPERFPSSKGGAGFQPLADYVHALGLKFGIHIMRGIPRAAAQKHLPIAGLDAQTHGQDAEADAVTQSQKATAEPDSEHKFQTISGNMVTAADVANPSSICGWNPDMYGLRADRKESQAYYDSIFALYAEWGVDYVKCDDICNTNMYPANLYSAAHEVEMIHAAIEKCGRPIVLSLSPGPALIEKAWHYEKYANMWRITDDFWDNWNLLLNMFDRCELWQNHVKQGCFPDCDMLPLGYLGKGFGEERQTKFTRNEQVTMMTLWCIFRSPLMLGAEMTKLDDWTLSLLTNREVLALLQDGRHGVQVCRTKASAVWCSWSDDGVCSCENVADRAITQKQGTPVRRSGIATDKTTEEVNDTSFSSDGDLTDAGGVCVALFNLTDAPAEVSVTLEEVATSLPVEAADSLGACAQAGKRLKLRELWSGREKIAAGAAISETVEAHGAALFSVSIA